MIFMRPDWMGGGKGSDSGSAIDTASGPTADVRFRAFASESRAANGDGGGGGDTISLLFTLAGAVAAPVDRSTLVTPIGVTLGETVRETLNETTKRQIPQLERVETLEAGKRKRKEDANGIDESILEVLDIYQLLEHQL